MAYFNDRYLGGGLGGDDFGDDEQPWEKFLRDMKKSKMPTAPKSRLDQRLTSYGNKQSAALALGTDPEGTGPTKFLTGLGTALDTPRRVVMSAGKELADFAGGNNASFDDFKRQYNDSYGWGDIEALKFADDDDKGKRVGKALAAFAGDVATDPLTYLTLGAAPIGKKALAEGLEQAGKAGYRQGLAGLPADEAAEAARRMASQSRAEQARLQLAGGADPTDLVLNPKLAEATKGLGKAVSEMTDDEVIEAASTQFGFELAQARLRSGDAGVRGVFRKHFGEARGEELFDALPKDYRGGMRVGVPFAKNANGETASKVLKGTGGGRTLEKLGLSKMDADGNVSGLLQRIHDARNTVRGSKSVRTVADNFSGRYGKQYGEVIANIKKDVGDLANIGYAEYAIVRNIDRVSQQRAHQLSAAGMLALADVTALRGNSKNTEQFDQHLEEFFESPEMMRAYAGRDDLSEEQAAALVAANKFHDQLKALGEEAEEVFGRDAFTMMRDYVPRQMTEEAKELRAAEKVVGGKQGKAQTNPFEARKKFANYELDETTGRLRLAGWKRLSEANEIMEETTGAAIFKTDPVEVFTEYVTSVNRMLVKGRIRKQMQETGLLLNSAPSTKRYVNTNALVDFANRTTDHVNREMVRVQRDLANAQKRRAELDRAVNLFDQTAAQQDEALRAIDDEVAQVEEQLDLLLARERAELGAPSQSKPVPFVPRQAEPAPVVQAAPAEPAPASLADEAPAEPTLVPAEYDLAGKTKPVKPKLFPGLPGQVGHVTAEGDLIAVKGNGAYAVYARVAPDTVVIPPDGKGFPWHPSGEGVEKIGDDWYTYRGDTVTLGEFKDVWVKDAKNRGWTAPTVVPAAPKVVPEQQAAPEGEMWDGPDNEFAQAWKALDEEAPAPAPAGPRPTQEGDELWDAPENVFAQAWKALDEDAAGPYGDQPGNVFSDAWLRLTGDTGPSPVGFEALAAERASLLARRQEILDKQAVRDAERARLVTEKDYDLQEVEDQMAKLAASNDFLATYIDPKNLPKEEKDLAVFFDDLVAVLNDYDDVARIRTEKARRAIDLNADDAVAKDEKLVKRKRALTAEQTARSLARANLITEKDVKSELDRALDQMGFFDVSVKDKRNLTSEAEKWEGLVGPAIIRDAAQLYYIARKDPNALSPFVEGVYQPWYTLFKTYATVSLTRGAGYHIRNLVSGFWQNGIGHVTVADHNLSATLISAKLAAAKQAERELGKGALPSAVEARARDILLAPKGPLATKPLGKTGLTLVDVMRASEEQLLTQGNRNLEAFTTQGSFAREERDLSALVRGNNENPLFPNVPVDDLNAGQKLANKAMTAWWVRKGGDIAAMSEEYLRTAALIKGMRTFGGDEAGRVMAKDFADALHFKYDDLSGTERAFKNVLPFYTWTRYSLPIQFRALVTDPGRMHRLLMATEHGERLFGNEDETYNERLPEWVRERMGFATRFEVGGNPITFAPDVPGTDLNKWLVLSANPVTQAKSLIDEGSAGMNPLLKSAIELKTGTDTFTGGKIVDQEAPAWAKALGVVPGTGGLVGTNEEGVQTVDGKLVRTVRNLLPPVGQAERLFPTTESSKGRALTSWLTFTGLQGPISTSTLTEDQVTAEIAERTENIDKGLDQRVGELGIDPEWFRQVLGEEPESILALLNAGYGWRADVTPEKMAQSLRELSGG